MTAAPGPQQPDEVRDYATSGGPFDRIELEDGSATTRITAWDTGLLPRPAAPSAQPDEVCPWRGPVGDLTCSAGRGHPGAHTPVRTPAQPVRDTEEGRR